MRSTDPVIQQFIDTHTTLLSHWAVKLVVSIGVMVFNVLFDVDLVNVYLAVAILIICDFIAGYVISAWLHHAVWDSKLGKKTLTKGAMYAIAMVAFHQTEVIDERFAYVTGTILVFIAITELYSVIENFHKAGFAWATFLLKVLSFYRKKKEEQIETIIKHF